MKQKIFRSTVLAALVVLLASCTIIMSYLYDYFGGIQEQQLRDELSLAQAGVENFGLAYLEDINNHEYRLTWVAETGEVLFDSRALEQTMENHGDRDEIRTAFACGEGTESRYSSTMMEKTVYYARRLADGTVLRISASHATVGLLLLGMLWPIAMVMILAVVLSAVLAHRMAKNITEPLNRLNLDQPLENDVYEELSPLLERIHRQHRQIDRNLRELKRRKADFEQITACMQEGLVLMNEQGIVVSINPAALKIFQTDRSSVGRDFLTLEHRYEVGQALEMCFESGHGEARCFRNGVEYQFDFSRINTDGQTVGAVLLVFDVTEQAQAERTRREFTANVSHELKTPLQSIMGSAELMENGLVKPEDMPRFVGHIRTESSRLMSLIDDIIHLSQLDDGAQLPMEPVDLLDVVNEAAKAIAVAAQARNINISIQGTSAMVKGVPQLLFELVYNLCDNAVNYNVDHGSVCISVTSQENGVRLSVKDTGIGIPPEHIPRIFERFYRVDKSHSKESGGTGLGLSIVKHAAACHQAKVDIHSEVGKGTEITVLFPAESTFK